MEILLSTDNNYVMPTGVLMTSISINNDDVHYHILIDKSFEQTNKELLSQVACNYGSKIDFYEIGEKNINSFPLKCADGHEYITIATYYRLLITEILPPDIHKLIYLDGDMVVRKSLIELWNTDICDYAIGVVHDMDEQAHIDSARLPYPMNTGYFNAGMLLINVDYWRENDCIHTFVDFIRQHSSVIKLHDQDVLNSVFFDKKKWIPITYNFQSGFLLGVKNIQYYIESLEEEIRGTEKDPVVIHYTFCDKPWLISCRHPQRFVWEYYRSVSLWRNEKVTASLTLREKLSLFLRKNNYWFFEHNSDSIHRNIYRRVILKR